jgi:hypothetical protein
MALRCDPAYAIGSSTRDTFSSWEWDVEHRAGYLSNQYWDQNWVPEAPDDDEPTFIDEDDHYDADVKPIVKPARVLGEVSNNVVGSKVVRDDTDNFVGQVAYHAMQAATRGKHFEMPHELAKEEALQITVIIDKEEEGGGEVQVPGHGGCSGALHGAAPLLAATSAWDATATIHAAKARSHSQERRRGLVPLACISASAPGGGMGSLSTGGLDASSGETGPAAHPVMTVAACALHRPPR